jgi:hypothetical protein
MSWLFRTMIVPATQVEYARSLSVAISGPSGDGMWTTGLSADGAEPATHYISSGYADEVFVALLPLTVFPPEGDPVTEPGKPEETKIKAAEGGMSTTLTKIRALFSSMDVTEQEPFTAMARLGLQLVQTPVAAEPEPGPV